MSMSARKSLPLVLLVVTIIAAALPARAIEPREVSFTTDDGVQISADFYAPKPDATPAPMVILLHMYRSNRTAWRPLIGPLHDAGFAVLAIDMRGHGKSATKETARRVFQHDTSIFKRMHRDVEASYNWLAARKDVDRTRFALVGASVGCSVALHYASIDPSVDVIVCLSPGVDYLGLDSKADIRKIKGRKIWLMAADSARERQGVEALSPLTEGVKAELFPGNDHGTRMFGKVPDLEQRIAKYLKKNVGSPTEHPVYGGIKNESYYLTLADAAAEIRPGDLRYYSSAREAEQRGLRKAEPTRASDERSDTEATP
jgi:pimeloyl-ACP methyl ester carboxylesterase